MFKGLTHRAQRVLTTLAQEEAKRSRSDQLQPEHVLLAILREGEGLGFKALRSLKIDPLELRDELERSLERKRAGFVLGDLPLSRRSRSLLETAAEEANMSSSEYIGTEHFVVAAAREQGAAFERFLSRYGVYYEQLRAAVRLLREPGQGAEERADARRPPEERKAPAPAPRGQAPARTPLLDAHARGLTALAACCSTSACRDHPASNCRRHCKSRESPCQ